MDGVEIIDISKLTVQGCKGCFSCRSATPGKCVIADDMPDILPKIIEAKVTFGLLLFTDVTFPAG